jgi:hypothetical protein
VEVDFNAIVKSFQPTLTTTVYSARDAIGAAQGLYLVDESKGTATLLSLSIIDLKNKAPGIDVLFYSQLPGGTITDNSALAITAADHASYFLGRVSIASTDWVSSTTQNVASNVVDVTKKASDCGIKLYSSGGDGKIYVVLMCVTVPSAAYAAGAGDLTVRLGVDQD